MVQPAQLAVWTALASGGALSVLGLLLSVPRSRRGSTRVFGAFLIVWSGFVVFANLSRAAIDAGNVAQASAWTTLHVPLLIVAYVPLAYFAAAYPARTGWITRDAKRVLALALPAAAGVAAFAVRPDLFHRGFVGEPPTVYSAWGPAYVVFSLLLSAAFYYAILVLHRNHDRSDNDLERRRNLYVLLALMLYVGYRAGESLVVFGAPALQGRAALGGIALPFVLDAAAGTIVVGYVGARLVASKTRLFERRATVASAVAAPLLFGLVSGWTFVAAKIPSLETLGLLRLGSVVLISYAVLRFELFDLDAKLKRALVAAGLLAAAGLGAVLLHQALLLVVDPTAALLGTQALLFGLLVAALVTVPNPLRSAASELSPGSASPQLEQRRLEVYETALLQAAAQGDVETDPDLSRLRDRLGISDLEHEVLRRVVLGGAQPERAEPETPEPGDLLDDRYHLASVIDQGRYGTTYQAWDRRLDRQVALKTLVDPAIDDARDARRFLREARLTARIEHPHVVRVYDFGYAGGTPYLVMEHVDGGVLTDRIDAPRAPAEAIAWTRQILDGLAAIHDQGILHRDLKPDNVILDADGQAKIADFGIALDVDADETRTGLPTPSEPAGTPAYMAPEVLEGGDPTVRSDVYAVGAVLYRLLAGRPYLDFEERSLPEIRRAVAGQEPRPLPDAVPDDLAAVVRTALAKDPDDRYGSAGAMADALAEVTPA